MENKYGDTVYTGCVKWFNRQGWGFITTNDGQDDIFVHWEALKSPGYKYLVQGEYVEFQIQYRPDAGEGKEYQAVNVVGVNGGKLMCENRMLAAKSREEYIKDVRQNKTETTNTKPHAKPNHTRNKPSVNTPVAVPLPVAGHQWVLIPQPVVQNNKRKYTNKKQ
jgi:CspA family cold shock protein